MTFFPVTSYYQTGKPGGGITSSKIIGRKIKFQWDFNYVLYISGLENKSYCL